MGLSSDLISQFVKITNDKKEVPKETTVYGTVVEHNGKSYVQLDGSELLTPVSTTTDLKDGERVTVMIKNHTATVTGNISSPSASGKELRDAVDTISEFEIIIAKKADVEALNAEKARIDTLTSENVTIKETLTANAADIDKLQTNTLTITEKLTAAEGNITKLQVEKIDAIAADAKFATIENLDTTNANVHNLDVTYGNFASATAAQFEALRAEIEKLEAGEIDVEQLKATFATIEQLNAEKARIDDLEAEVADIDTLIFGSATGDTIQSSFANAVIAQLGDAQIKSAMIDNVSASKVNSGEIDTNKVSVGSEDGKLLISDETIQISDNTRVRVQIGKDASNDYSINVWDADGNLMFSKGGITDSAIKSAIIRNDMVSDTANIAAHKLDIDSLFEEINGSDKTIKSTRIYLDDEGQSLDIAFESMTTDIENLQNGVSSQGTQISAIQGQIATKIWQQDIENAVSDVNTTTENLSTQYEEIVQDVDSLTTTVANHTSEISKKADSSTVTEVSDKVASMETDVSGFKTTVSETYATKTELSDDIESVTSRVSTVEQTASGLAVGLSETDAKADDAAKTATNFLTYTSDGLEVGNKTSGTWSGFRTQITNTAFNILDSVGTALASYGAKIIELGKNAADAVIKFCGGKGQIEYDSDDNFFQVTGENLRLKGSSMASLYTTYYDGSHTAEKTSVNSTPQGVHIFAEKSIDIDPDTMAGNWENSEISVTPEGMNVIGDNVNITSRYGTSINSVSGDISIEPLSTTNVKSKMYVTNPGTEKTGYNDGVTGWYIGGDGTMHGTRESSGAYIGFHYANSGPTTSYIKESKSGTMNINGMDFGVNKHLWSGANYMNEAQSITLSEAISAQANGIVLVWSYYSNGAAQDYNFQFHFVPKWVVSKYPGKGSDYMLANHTGNILGHKYLYISDTKITGQDYNDNGSVAGTYATYINTAFVLRAVIGV